MTTMIKHFIVWLMLFLLPINSFAQLNEYWVSPTGSGAACTNPGTGGTACATVNQAITTSTLGASGTKIHVLAGTYNVTRAGGPSYACWYVPSGKGGVSASRMLTLISETPYLAKLVCSDPSGGGRFAANDAPFVVWSGFDMTGPDNSCEGIVLNGGDSIAINNKVHDMPAPGTLGQTCYGPGGSAIGDNGGPARNLAVGNFVDNIGFGSLTNPANPTKAGNSNTVQGIYFSGVGSHIWDNIVSRISGWPVQYYHVVTDDAVVNNTLMASGRGCMIFDSSNAAPSFFNSSIMNNICIDTGNNHGGDYGAGYGITLKKGNTTDVFRNNLLVDSQPGPWNMVTPGTLSGNYCDVAGCNITLTAAQASAANLFVNYTGNALTGDYHLKAGSAAAGTGIGPSGCVLSGCAPTTDRDGVPMSNPPPIGAYTYGSTTVPGAPTSLTATPH